MWEFNSFNQSYYETVNLFSKKKVIIMLEFLKATEIVIIYTVVGFGFPTLSFHLFAPTFHHH